MQEDEGEGEEGFVAIDVATTMGVDDDKEEEDESAQLWEQARRFSARRGRGGGGGGTRGGGTGGWSSNKKLKAADMEREAVDGGGYDGAAVGVTGPSAGKIKDKMAAIKSYLFRGPPAAAAAAGSPEDDRGDDDDDPVAYSAEEKKQREKKQKDYYNNLYRKVNAAMRTQLADEFDLLKHQKDEVTYGGVIPRYEHLLHGFAQAYESNAATQSPINAMAYDYALFCGLALQRISLKSTAPGHENDNRCLLNSSMEAFLGEDPFMNTNMQKAINDFNKSYINGLERTRELFSKETHKDVCITQNDQRKLYKQQTSERVADEIHSYLNGSDTLPTEFVQILSDVCSYLHTVHDIYEDNIEDERALEKALQGGMHKIEYKNCETLLSAFVKEGVCGASAEKREKITGHLREIESDWSTTLWPFLVHKDGDEKTPKNYWGTFLPKLAECFFTNGTVDAKDDELFMELDGIFTTLIGNLDSFTDGRVTEEQETYREDILRAAFVAPYVRKLWKRLLDTLLTKCSESLLKAILFWKQNGPSEPCSCRAAVVSLLIMQDPLLRNAYLWKHHQESPTPNNRAMAIMDFARAYNLVIKMRNAENKKTLICLPIERFAMCATFTLTAKHSNGEFPVDLPGAHAKSYEPSSVVKLPFLHPSLFRGTVDSNPFLSFLIHPLKHSLCDSPDKSKLEVSYELGEKYSRGVDVSFVALFLGTSDAAEEITLYARELFAQAFALTLKTQLLRVLATRASMTNPYVLQDDLVFKLGQRESIVHVQFVLNMLSAFYGEDFLQALRRLPPAFVNDATNSDNRASFIIKLLYNTLSIREESVKRYVLEWALHAGRNACDAMEIFLRLQSKLKSTDRAFAEARLCVEQSIFTIEGQVLLKQRENMSKLLSDFGEFMKTTFVYKPDFEVGRELLCQELHRKSKELITQNEHEWEKLTCQVDLLEIVGSYYMGRIAQVYDEMRCTGGKASPLQIGYGDRKKPHYLDSSDLCRCLPVADYAEEHGCYRFYAANPFTRVKVKRSEFTQVRMETQRAHSILAEAFLTQTASIENTLGYQSKSRHATVAVQRARQQALLSFMASSSRVYACRFVFKHDPEHVVRWCVGIE